MIGYNGQQAPYFPRKEPFVTIRFWHWCSVQIFRCSRAVRLGVLYGFECFEGWY